MSKRNVAEQQPGSFDFSLEATDRVDQILAKYPKGKEQSAVLPLLDLAQRECKGWVPIAAMEKVAEIVGIPYIRVYEVATFYTMFNLEPVGENFIQLCRTTPCWLRGSDKIAKACKKKLGIDFGETTKDGKFTLVEVECLAACVNAPIVQINDDYYEDLTEDIMENIIDNLSKGKKIAHGTQIKRTNSAPKGKLTTLKEAKNNA